MSIVLPINGSRKYAVTIPHSKKYYLWTQTEIIQFIPFIIKYTELRTPVAKEESISEAGLNLKVKSLISSKYILKKNYSLLNKNQASVYQHNSTNGWKTTEIPVLEQLLAEEFKDYNISISSFTVKQVLNVTPCIYKKVLNAYKTLYIDHNISVTKEMIESLLK